MTFTSESESSAKRRRATEDLSPEAWLVSVKDREAEALGEKDFDHLAEIAPGAVLRLAAARYFALIYRRVLYPSTGRSQRQADQEVASAQEETAQQAAGQLHTAVLSSLTADTTMTDGRRLGDWTIGELRTLNGAFAMILERAGTSDDSRTVDQVMRPRDWRKLKA